nr:hypothetical protein [Neobacillus sp. Marseille-Q6967]
MIYVPQPAYCHPYRHGSAKTHDKTTEPAEWFSNKYQNSFSTLSFDFFISWGKASHLSNEFWIKRNVNKAEFAAEFSTYWPCVNQDILQTALEACEGRDFLERYGRFAASLNFEAKYQIFHDSGNWAEYPSKFITLNIDSQGNIENVKKQDFEAIKKEIRRLSGGEVKVMKKNGLKVANTKLECYLANHDTTGAAWPGDVDLLMLDQNEVPMGILEFKKNTVEPGKPYHRPIKNESLNNYYRTTGRADDNRKYNRIAMLRDFLKKDAPIINLYYPTWESKREEENIIKLEKITGNVGYLKVEDFKTLPVPYTASDKITVIKTVLGMI